MPSTDTEQLTHAIQILNAIESLETPDPDHMGQRIVMDMGAPTVAVTAMAMLRSVFGHWGEATGQNPMELLAMVRQDLELKKG